MIERYFSQAKVLLRRFVCDLAQLDRIRLRFVSAVEQSRFSRDTKGYSQALARA
jgi:hypothetical protein